MTDPWIPVIAGAALAGLVQGLSGFAFSMVAMSVWAWTLDPRLAAVLAVHGSLCGQVIAAVRLRRGLHLATVWPYLAGGAAGLPLGMLVLRGIDPHPFRLVVGAVLAVGCPLMLVAGRLPAWRWGGRAGDALAGAAGGVMGALGGFSGVVPTLWCTLRRLDKDVQRQVIQNFNLAVLAATMASYVAAGLVTRETWAPLGLETAALALPVLAGLRLFDRLGGEGFRRVVLVLLGASGLAMLVNALLAPAGR